MQTYVPVRSMLRSHEVQMGSHLLLKLGDTA